jgi:hypothetical protein
MPAPPRKPVSEMSEDEFREWKQPIQVGFGTGYQRPR